MNSKSCLKRFTLAMAAGVVLSLGGCTEEWDTESTGSSIQFGVSMSGKRTPESRSCPPGSKSPHEVRAMRSEVPGDTVYLHTDVTEGFPGDTFEEEGQAPATRAAVVVEDKLDAFGVSAFCYTGEWSNTLTPDYFHNRPANKKGKLTPASFWPGRDNKVRFLAYAPQNNGNYSLSDVAAAPPHIAVKVPSNAGEQQDLLVAYSKEYPGDAHREVYLHFRHAMTAIRFVCGSDMVRCTVKSISIKNVYSQATFTYAMGTAEDDTNNDGAVAGTWDNKNNPEGVVFTQEFTDREVTKPIGEDMDGVEITNDSEHFIMIPQTLPQGATLELVIQQPGKEEQTLSADISGKEWKAGYTVTYHVSYSKWIQKLELTELKEYSYFGRDEFGNTMFPFTINSYRTGSDDGSGVDERPIPWVAEFCDLDGETGLNGKPEVWTKTPPDWLTFPTSGAGGREVFNETQITIQNEVTINLDEELQKSTPKGTSGIPYNLAHSSGAPHVENTANCYIVDAPGYYMLPLVYGNAIKDGASNPQAYRYSGAASQDVLPNLINHTGADITDPYILNNRNKKGEKLQPVNAELVWQDEQNLVTEIEYVSSAYNGMGGIKFSVPAGNIKQGNAVIAIKDNTGAMWSWHIWVQKLSAFKHYETVEVTNHTDNKFDLMTINLGWCSENPVTFYPKRSCKVRVTADKISKEVTIIYHPFSKVWRGNSTYYQWGRKDPFQGQGGASLYHTKIWWDYRGWRRTDTPESRDFTYSKDCIDTLISMPNVWHKPPRVPNSSGSSYDSRNKTFVNLWDAKTQGSIAETDVATADGSSFIVTAKTVYDPSPVGFKVPPLNVFTGFTTTGMNVAGVAAPWTYFNGGWEDTQKSYVFKANSKNITFISVPTVGYRDFADNAIVYWAEQKGYFWTSGMRDDYRAYCLHHISWSNGVFPVDQIWVCDGFPVRPCKE